MSDIVSASEIEPCKENIQPLREGRRSASLKKTVVETKSVEDIEKEKQIFEIRLQNYVGNDPLELWIAYVDANEYLAWTKETYPTGGAANISTTERCVQAFLHDNRYKQDARYLRVVLQYADMVRDPLEIFAFMEKAQIGITSALYWKAWGRAHEARKDWNKAELLYQRGVDVLAKPEDMMKSIQTEFEARMFRRIKAEAKAAAEGSLNGTTVETVTGALFGSSQSSIDENRAPLSSLRGSSQRGLAPPQASGTSVASSSTNNKKRGGLEVFVDSEFMSSDDRKSRKLTDSYSEHSAQHEMPLPNLAPETTRQKENNMMPEKWNTMALPQDPAALAAVNRLAKATGAVIPTGPIQIFVDPGLASSEPTPSKSLNIGRATALRPRDPSAMSRSEAVMAQPLAGHPYRFVIQSEQYPRGSNSPTVTSNGAKEKAAYDRTTVYPGDGKEYSFEEIRAKVYAQRSKESQRHATSSDAMECDDFTTVEDSIQIASQMVPQSEIVEMNTPVKVLTPFKLQIPTQLEASSSSSPSLGQPPVINAMDPANYEDSIIRAPRSAPSTPVVLPAGSVEFEVVQEPLLVVPSSHQEFIVFQEEFAQLNTNANAIKLPPTSGFVIFEDVNIAAPVVKRQPFGVRSDASTGAAPFVARSAPADPIVQPENGTVVTDENAPLSILVDTPAIAVPSPVPSPVVLAPSSVALVPFEDVVEPVPMQSLKPHGLQVRQAEPSAILTSNPPLQAVRQVSSPSMSKALSTFHGEDPHRPTLATLAQTLGPSRDQEDECWKYDPAENMTNAGFTINTREAMDEVMGFFQFEKTLTDLKPADLYGMEGDLEVTASIVIPQASLHAAPVSNFMIFEDNVGAIEPMQSPLVASFGQQQRNSQDSVVRTTPQPLLIFEDPAAPQHSSLAQEEDVIGTPMQKMSENASRVAALLAQSPSIEHKSDEPTINFTMSGMTTSCLDIDTINTQNLTNLVQQQQQQQQQQKRQLPAIQSIYVLPLPQATCGPVANPIINYTQPQLLSMIHQVGLAADKNLKDCTGMGAAPQVAIGQVIELPGVNYSVKQQLSGSSIPCFLVENDSGAEFTLQISGVHDYYISKRIMCKLGSNSQGILTDERAFELSSSVVNYSSAFVFEDKTLLISAYRNDIGTSTLQELLALRSSDPKAVEEILIWYYASQLLKLFNSLHALGFVAGGSLNLSEFWASVISLDTTNGYKGVCLKDLSSLIDLDCYSAQTRFSRTSESGLVSQLSGSAPWLGEPDMYLVASLVHELLHGKEMQTERVAMTGRWKSKMAPKMFWQTSLWLKFFDVLLNMTGLDQVMIVKTIDELTKPIDEHIHSKITALRFQMGKISF